MSYGILPILKKEVREILRDPYILGMAVVLPLILLFLFAYALNLDVRNVTLAVADLDRSPLSRAYVSALAHSERFQLRAQLDDPDRLLDLLDRGEVQVALVLPRGFERSLRRGATAEIQVLIDGTFPTAARVIQGYVDGANDAFLRDVLRKEGWAEGFASRAPVLEPVPRVYFNPELKSLNFIAPGLIPVLLMAFPPLLSALAIVREKERGSIQQIFVSPIRPWALIVGKVLPYGAIAFGELLLILGVTRYLFDVPMAGSLGLYLLASFPYVLSTVAIGLLVSTLTRSQLAAMLLAIVLSMMPSFLFSGFLFPVFTMPRPIQLYAYLFPARYFVDITLQVFLRGAGLSVWWPALAALSAYTAAILGVAVFRFRKRMG